MKNKKGILSKHSLPELHSNAKQQIKWMKTLIGSLPEILSELSFSSHLSAQY